MKENFIRKVCVGVIGSRIVEEEVAIIARKVGALIYRLGTNLVCGGMGGVMEEACRGFFEERKRMGGLEKGKGVTIGIIPGGNPEDANPYVDIVIPTSMGLARNFIVVQTSDVVIAIGGEAGTLSEIAMAWQLGKKIIAIESTGKWASKVAGTKIDGRRNDEIIGIKDLDELDRMLRNIVKNKISQSQDE